MPRTSTTYWLFTLLFMLVALTLAWFITNTKSARAMIEIPPVRQATAPQETLSLAVSRPAVNIRRGPGTEYDVISVAKEGEMFTATGRNATGAWIQIALTDGQVGWISAPLVRLDGEASALPVITVVEIIESVASATPTASPAAGSAPAPGASTIRPGDLSGRLLYSAANDEARRWELWEYNFATGENKPVANWRTEIAVSADGKQIAYFAWPPEAADKTGIWIMDADFSRARLVVPGGAYPSFSPGGDRMVANGGDMLYVFRTDGTGIRSLTKGEYPAWSPVDNQIVHRACVGGGCGLWIIDADSNNPNARKRLTTGASDGQPAWSPDGKRLAYISKEDGNFEVYVIGVDGSNKARVTTNPSSDGLPVWSLDGQWIAFRSDRDGQWGIYVAKADGSNVRKVVDADVLPLWFFEKMAWRR